MRARCPHGLYYNIDKLCPWCVEIKAKLASNVALECAKRMRAFLRYTDTHGISRVASRNNCHNPDEFIEYIPPTADIRYHGKCAIGCDDSTHREF